MALIHILDKQTDQIIGVLDTGEYNGVRRSSLDNINQFDFTGFKHFDKLEKRNRVLVQDADGFFHEYIITYTKQHDRYQKEVMSDASFIDLAKAKVIEPRTLEGQTSVTIAPFILSGTEWQVGDIDFTGTKTITIDDYTNPYDLLKRIASEFELEIRFRVEVSGNRIVGRFVDLKKQIAGFEGKEIEFGKDLIGITRKEDNSRIVTALLGVGPQREDGTRLTVFVEDQDALARWGRNGKHLVDVYEVESSDANMTLEQLTELTEAELKKRINSIVSYECNAAAIEHIPGFSHEKIRLGQTVRIKDIGYTPPLYVEARIQEIEENPATRQILSFKLGNFVEYKKEELESQIKLLKELLKQKASNAELQTVYESALQQAEEKANQAEANAKVYAETVSQEAESNAKSHADVVSQQAESNAKNHADSIAEQKKQEAIQQAIADAEAKVNQAKTELEADIALKADAEWVNGQLVLKENAITKSNTAPASPKVGQLWLDTSTTPNVLKRWSGSAWVKATPTTAGEVGAYTKTEVDNALNSKVSVTTYTADKNGIISRLDSAESRITQTENEIATKVSRTEFESLQIDGRNLLPIGNIISRNSSDFTRNGYEISFTHIDRYAGVSVLNLRNLMKLNEEYILTFKVKKNSGTLERIGGHYDSSQIAILSYTVDGQELSFIEAISTIPSIDDGNWHECILRIKRIVDVEGDGTDTYSTNRIIIQPNRNSNTIVNVTIKDIKLERSNHKPTAWSPAPEDVQGQIDGLGSRMTTAETSITQLSNQIQLKANKSEVDTLAGRMTSAESSINILTNQISLKADQTTVDELETRVSSAEINIDALNSQISLKANQTTVDSLTNRISSAESSINLLSNQIDLKVDVDGVISAINQTAESIKIQASKVDLSGYVTFTNLSTPGQTTIDGGNIKANSITANKLNVTSLSAISANLGTVTAGTITGVNITGSTITQNTSGGSIILNNKGLTVRDSSGKDRIQIQTSTSPLFPDPSYLVFEPTRGTGKVIVGTSLHGLTSGLFLGFPEDTSETAEVLIKSIGTPNNYISLWSPRVLVTGGTLYLSPYRYASAGGGLDASNSDIINVNALYFSDPSSGTVLSALSGGSFDLLDTTGSWRNLYLRPTPNGEVRVTAYGSWSEYRPIRASSFPTGSMAEYKEDIRVWERSALEQIRQATIYEYYLKTELEQGIYRKRQGLVIGEGYNTPDGVIDGDGVEQYLMNAWSWKAIQELDIIVQNVQDDIELLKIENQYLKQKIQQMEAKIA